MYKAFSVIIAAVLAVSCSEVFSDMEYDIAPIVTYIYLEDSDGKNLLDPETRAEGFDVGKVSVEYQGVTYAVNMNEATEYGAGVSTKAYMPHFDGLKLKTDLYGKWMIAFGELDGTENIDNENLVINWGDGTTNTITIFNHFKWKFNGSPSITRRFYMDGQKQDTDIAVFKFIRK